MKRWPILFAIAAAAILFPANAADVGELLPVELIYIYREADQVCVATDTEAVGAGPDLNAAMEDLHATAPGAVFLDTADFLVLTPDTLTLLPELTNALRPATKVCVGLNVHADADLTKYLTAHPPYVTLGNLRSGKKNVPILQRREAGYRLESRDQ